MKVIKFYEQGHNPSQLIVQWNLGNTCNYSCEYCPSILHNGTRPWVDIALIENTLLKIKNYFPQKTMKVEFLGGEITLYKDFIPLMKFCKDNNIPNMIFTNASRTFRHWEEVLPYLDEILLTFHPNTTDKNHFENIIKLCRQHKSKFYVHVAMPKNVFWDTASYATHLKDTYPELLISSVLMMDKEHRMNYDGFYYDYSEEEIKFVKKSDSSKTRFVAEYEDASVEILNITDIKHRHLNQFKGLHCGTEESISIINIDAKGIASTSLCRQKSKINIYVDELDQLFQHHVCQKAVCENPSDIRIFKILKK
jgi:organic radical activating enzyme